MRRIIAVLSVVTLAVASGCGAGTTPGEDATAATDAKTSSSPAASDPAGEPAPAARQDQPAPSRGSKRLAAGLARSGPAEVTLLARQVAARMPRHDRALHRRLAAVIHDESRHAGLDPLLVLALIHVESSFDPSAVSGAGAVGLMQLRERTLLQELERSGIAAADPLDPVANVRAGIRYLRRLVTAFGNTDLALMAYNAGPHRIGAYRRAGGIPERFYAYPRRIRGELERLRSTTATVQRRDGDRARAAASAG